MPVGAPDRQRTGGVDMRTTIATITASYCSTVHYYHRYCLVDNVCNTTSVIIIIVAAATVESAAFVLLMIVLGHNFGSSRELVSDNFAVA